MGDFLPHRDLDLKEWARVFASYTLADPAQYGLSTAQAEAYSAAQQAFAAVMAVIGSPDTRTPTAVQRKNMDRQELIRQSRRLARIVQAHEGTTDAMRSALGLTVPKKRARMAGLPMDRPQVRVLGVTGDMQPSVQLRICHGFGNGRPDTAKGYSLYSYIGDNPPSQVSQWTFVGNDTELRRSVKLPADVPSGTAVYFVANWFNTRMQPGPASQPVMTRAPGRWAA